MHSIFLGECPFSDPDFCTILSGGESVVLATLEAIPGKRVKEVLGVVCGSTIRARWIGKDIAAAFRTLVGGEIVEYTEMLQAARRIALERMVEEARKLGADAILGVRLSTSMVMSGAAEIIAYGTAVQLEDFSDGLASQ